jgi:hypothetical protein
MSQPVGKTELPGDALKTWPERIYLQHGTDENPPPWLGSENGEITWASHDVEGNDVPYIRADLATVQSQDEPTLPYPYPADTPLGVAYRQGIEVGKGFGFDAGRKGLSWGEVSMASIDREQFPTIQASGRPRVSIDAALRLRALVEKEPGVRTTFNLGQIEAWLDAAGIEVGDD